MTDPGYTPAADGGEGRWTFCVGGGPDFAGELRDAVRFCAVGMNVGSPMRRVLVKFAAALEDALPSESQVRCVERR